MATTARELAEMLGVSPATVSIALNGKKGISEETRAMILEAADKHGLKKNVRRSNSKLITLVIYKKHGWVDGDTAFFSALMDGIGAQIADSGYRLQLFYFYASQDHAEQWRHILSSESAGLIILATEMADEDFTVFADSPLPVVILDAALRNCPYDCVTINNIQGVELAIRHLLDKGHRRFGYLCSDTPIPNFCERRQGYQIALASSPYRDECTSIEIPVDPAAETAYADMNRYLDEHTGPLPTAFFADNDVIAYSCMLALTQHGYKLPEDISVVGFDNTSSNVLLSPALTSVNVPKYYMGRYAVQILIARLEQPDDIPTMRHSINTTLIERDSVRQI
ncbi:MAG: LacI family DNA-binding transcriptional regulator [Lachnospiraceae bacterium]|nr:LacI family DNA-binding transcriptional regulator [Lachnospiraceae bacterium]